MARFVFKVESAYDLENGRVHLTGQAPGYDRLINRCICGVYVADERVGEIEVKELSVTRTHGGKRDRFLKGTASKLTAPIREAILAGQGCELRWEKDVAERPPKAKEP